jgi:putative membrane-bound dehydrogenase-like protein
MPRRLRLLRFVASALGSLALLIGPPPASGDEPSVIPHGQSRLPGEPLTPAEAIRKMTVPPGFTVEIVASEPDIVNPVAMTFDERGRAWITESLEYPRRSPGPGRDRVKVLEDTDGDGKADKFTVFAEGLNIPSGIAVGHGGVWVANAPDILFLQDTDGDGKADRREVVVTGFGRDDTHELPNSLTWGPDGWLYGWNGVFNRSHVNYRGKTHDFTCAIFRIHPGTREFELFCEGTSNPWGIAWDTEGSAFASACVIDHLWHLSETGYYHRQGGPYPPFTWKIESIVAHKHQQAAYCGIHFYDSDAYPAAYRERLFMGNIHGNSVNMDRLRRKGSTYEGLAEPDFLAANDAWFMPVSQQTGPDGSLYILDWYDRYHCYQDANRDPGGIDRLKGRLYRVRYGSTPRRAGFDLGKASDDALIDLIGSGNGYDRDTARRLLSERETHQVDRRLQAIALDSKSPRRTRMNALWTRISRSALDSVFQQQLLDDKDPGFRAWGVRAAGNQHRVAEAVREKVVSLARDPSPDVHLQVAIAARKIEGVEPVALLAEIASACGDDKLIPRIVWRNLHPLLQQDAARFVAALDRAEGKPGPGLIAILPRALEKMLSPREPDVKTVAGLLGRLIATRETEPIRQAVDALAARIREKSLSASASDKLRDEIRRVVPDTSAEGHAAVLPDEIQILIAYWRDARALKAARALFMSPDQPAPIRLKALDALIYALPTDSSLASIKEVVRDGRRAGPVEFRGRVLGALGTIDSPAVASLVLDAYPGMEADLKPRAVEVLTQRTAWSLALLKAMGAGKVDAAALNVNQVRRLLASNDAGLVNEVKARWGTIRDGRNPDREQAVKRVREFLRKTPGDPDAGAQVFKKICAQCHKIYGEGQDVGPEITLNGRGSYEQLLSNVLDPSLVIGASYQGTTVATIDGRVLNGLLVEQSPQRIVLKLQGGKLESIPASQVEEMKVSPLSLMPEDLEKQLQPQELADLFAFITLDKPPGDPAAKPLPGASEIARSPARR